ncbi:Aminopeptidase N, partial [Frankliniella fusca]
GLARTTWLLLCLAACAQGLHADTGPRVVSAASVPEVSAGTSVPGVSADTSVPGVSAGTSVPGVSTGSLAPGVSTGTLAPVVLSPGSTSTGFRVLSYDVQLLVDDGDTFDTSTLMTLEADEAVDEIVVHARDIVVDPKVSVYGRVSGVSTRIPCSVQVDGEEVHIALSRPLTVGVRYEVTMTASGTLGNPSDGGLVRATFDKGSSWVVAARGAGRRLFPCVDTPDALADITLRVSRPSSHVALANADLNKTEDIAAASSRDTFATARLAPHQVGLVVAPLQGAVLDQDAAVALWARAGAAPVADRVLRYAGALSDAVENLSGLPAALRHVAVVALPGLRAAAPAAPGLVQLDEAQLVAVVNAAVPPSAHRAALLHVAEALAQPEVRAAARPLRWRDAWATRALAAHLRHRLADQVAGRWQLSQQQVSLQMQDVLEAGGWVDSVADPAGDEDDGYPSRADVDRGAALIRMLEYAISPKRFDEAVRSFYQLSAQRPVSADDLVDSLADATYAGSDDLPPGVTVAAVLASWTANPGYPVVTVLRDYEDNTMTVSQKPFSWSAHLARDATEWWLPLSYTYAQEAQNDRTPDPRPRAWLVPGENDMVVEMVHLSPFDWVYFNMHLGAPYRVNYDVPNWLMLTTELRSVRFDGVLPPVARAHLLADAFALARAGELDYVLALDLLPYLEQEDDAVPWQVARRSLAFLEARLEGAALELLRQLESLLLLPVYTEAQFQMDGEGEAGAGPAVLLRRELAATWACEAGLRACLDHADGLYRQWRVQGSPPPPGFAEATLCRAVAADVSGALDGILVALGRSSLVGGERLSYVRAAGCAPTEALLEKVVDQALSVSGPFLASEVSDLLLTIGSKKPTGLALVTHYLEKYHYEIRHRTGDVDFVRTLSLHLASQVSSQDQLNELVAAVRAAVRGAGEAADGVVLEAAVRRQVAVNLDWSRRHAEEVDDWLRVYVGTRVPVTTPAPTSTDADTTTALTTTTMTTTTMTTTTSTMTTTSVPAGASLSRPGARLCSTTLLLLAVVGRLKSVM